MKTAFWMVTLSLLLASGCESSSDAAEGEVKTSAKATTRLYVRTRPPGAKIRLDGQPRPETSPQLFEVPADVKRMTVEVELEGHGKKNQVVEIVGGRIIRVEFDFADVGETPAEARPPTQPSVGAAAKLIWERVMNPPEGWTIEKSFIVPPDQTAAIGKKLGGPIKKLSNTIYSAHGQRVQVNAIECWTNADAEEIHKSVLAMKGDPAYALEFGDTVVEFVGTFDVAFAKRAARELGLAPGPGGPSIWDRLMDRPQGWKIEQWNVKSLTGRIRKLSNATCSAHGRRFRVNVYECETQAAAAKLHRDVLATKDDPAYAVRSDSTVVEFLGTFDAAFARRLARDLGLQPRPGEPQAVSFGPVVDQVLREPKKRVANLLDLETGQQAIMREFGTDDRQTHRWIREHKMDLTGIVEMGLPAAMLFDCAVYENPNISWDEITPQGIVDHQWLNQTEPKPIVVVGTEDPSKLPLTCLFETREKTKGVLQLVGLSDDQQGVKIRYRLVRRATADARNTLAPKEIWTCSMHPQIKLSEPGKCPICGMDLILRAGDSRDDVLRMEGKVAFDESRLAHVTIAADGRVERVHVASTGVQVRRGDPLVDLHSPTLIAAQHEFLQGRKAHQRAEGAGGSQYPNAADSKSLLQAAEEKLRLLGMLDSQLQELQRRGTPLESWIIYAPKDGIVVQKNVAKGTYLQQGAKIFTIADPAHVWVYLQAHETELRRLRPGQHVELTAGAYPGETFQGRIVLIDPVVNQESQTVRVRADVPNEGGKLRPGMSVQGIVRTPAAADVQAPDRSSPRRWTCSMHPQVSLPEPGKCPICGMDLIESVPSAHSRQVRAQMRILENTLQQYRLDVGSYPTTGQNLKALREKPADLPEAAKWQGPYLKGTVPSDPWGRPYRYQSPGRGGRGRFSVWSAGPDGVDGTPDDIANGEPKSSPPAPQPRR